MSKKLTEEQKRLNKLILERANLARQESLLGTKFDLVKRRIKEVEAAIREADTKAQNTDTDGNPPLNDIEMSFLRGGMKADLLKSLRQRLGLGLQDCLNLVRYHQEKHGFGKEE